MTQISRISLGSFIALIALVGFSAPVQAYSYRTDAPTCSLWNTDSSINEGDSTELVWTTGNAEYVYINEGIGEVSDSGAEDVSPDETTTYTLSAYGYDGQVVQCSTTISVYEDNNDRCDARPWYDWRGWHNNCDRPYPYYPYNYYQPAPTCTISISGYQYQPTHIYNQTATLSWRSYNATSASISGIGSVAVNGAQVVYPQQHSQYYTLTVYGPGGTATCSTSGQYTYPMNYTQYGTVYNPYISLTQIPYTGIDLGIAGSILYFAALLSFALAGGYLMVYFNGGVMRSSFAGEVKMAARNQLTAIRSLFS